MNIKSTFALGFGFLLAVSGFATSPTATIKAWSTQCGDYKVNYTISTRTLNISWEVGGFGQISGTSVSTLTDKFAYETLDNGMPKGKFVVEQELGLRVHKVSLMSEGTHIACGPMSFTL